MQKSTDYTNGVIGVVNLARKFNNEIGVYSEHFINENFQFIVRLSNGRLKMSTEIAQDYEAQPTSVTGDRVKAVADTFVAG